MCYTHLLPILIHGVEIMLKEIKFAMFPYHPKHNPNATCGYHVGYKRHSTKAYYILKSKVQNLLDQKLICFTEDPCQIILKIDHP